MLSHPPEGNDFHIASAYMLLVASVLLFLMLIMKFGKQPSSKMLKFIPEQFFSDAKTNKSYIFVYGLLFALVFSSTMSFFVDP